MDIKQLQYRLDRMIKADDDNQEMFQAIDDMWNMKWELPPELADLDWVRKMVSSDPHDAVRAGTRVLATIIPSLTLTPLTPNQETREQMDRIEKGLVWHFENAMRRKGSPLFDIVRHAMLYDKVACQVVYMPYQEKATGKLKNKYRQRASRRYGPFSIIVRDPKDVFIDTSEWMTERVLHRYTMSATEIVDFYGEKAGKVKARIAETTDDGANLHYTIFDYTDYDNRVVYACEQDSRYAMMQPVYDDPIILFNEEQKLPFLPWVVRTGGSQLIPMLYSIYKADQWADQNIFETIMSSEIIAYAAAPRYVIESASPELRETQYGEPNREKEIMPGESFQQLRPPEFDQNMTMMSDRLQGRISKSTVPNVLQTGDFPSGTAFATLNLATQSGVKAMNPYKRLAEEALADIFAQMLYWIDYTGDTIESFPENANKVTGETEYIEISKDDFDVESLYIKVELSPDVPTDRMSRINAAVMSNQNLFYSNRRALEDIGVTQPGAEIDQWYEEQQRKMDFDLQQQAKQMQLEMGMQMQMQQAMMKMQQEQMQQQQQPPPNAAGSQGDLQTMMRNPALQQLSARNTGRGFENTRGSAGFNPAIGGSPPAMANPEGTRESQNINNLVAGIGEGV